MKNLSTALQLNKKSIQILDDKALVDVKGGADRGVTCNEGSCNVGSCGYGSCKQN